MKAKTYRVWAVTVECPKCEAEIGSPRVGSLLWLAEDVERCGGHVTCWGCGRELTVSGPAGLGTRGS